MNAPIDAHKLLPVTDGASPLATHLVKNQASPLTGFNAFDQDAVLSAAVQREVPWAAGHCQALGRLVGDEDIQELACLANRHLPELKTHDRYGNRIDWRATMPAPAGALGTRWPSSQ